MYRLFTSDLINCHFQGLHIILNKLHVHLRLKFYEIISHVGLHVLDFIHVFICF